MPVQHEFILEFQTATYEHTEIIIGLPLYHVSMDAIIWIGDLSEREEKTHHKPSASWIGPSDSQQVHKGQIAISGLANPCIIVALSTQKNNFFMLHSVALTLTSEQLWLISKARGGIAGGGRTTLNRHRHLLTSNHIRILEPPEITKHGFKDFTLAVVRRPVEVTKEITVPMGIYWAYPK